MMKVLLKCRMVFDLLILVYHLIVFDHLIILESLENLILDLLVQAPYLIQMLSLLIEYLWFLPISNFLTKADHLFVSRL